MGPITLRRRVRKERTPYYMVGITDALAAHVRTVHDSFVRMFGRDYEDEDPQFWKLDSTGLKPTPAPADVTDFLQAVGDAMLRTKHPAAHVHAMLTTQRIIFGCGDCFDMDHCPSCNFRSVPEGWTKAWEEAARQWEKWAPQSPAPSMGDMMRAARLMR